MLDLLQLPIQFHIPSDKPMRDFVQSIWQVKRDNVFHKEVIVPKGIVEIIFNFSTDVNLKADLYNAEFLLPKCFVQGYHTSPIHLSLPPNHFLFGVVLTAAGARQVLGVPPGKLVRQCIDLTLIDPAFGMLWHQLAEHGSFQERRKCIASWLLHRVSHLQDRDRAFNALLGLDTKRKLSVSGISDWLCYSPRQLSRKFYELTGMNAEQSLLYLKYLKSKKLIHASDMSLSQIAYFSDFSDQSHFIKTFKRFTHLAPNTYRKRKSQIEGHYFENVR